GGVGRVELAGGGDAGIGRIARTAATVEPVRHVAGARVGAGARVVGCDAHGRAALVSVVVAVVAPPRIGRGGADREDEENEDDPAHGAITRGAWGRFDLE